MAFVEIWDKVTIFIAIKQSQLPKKIW
jgi:hypothetical protein